MKKFKFSLDSVLSYKQQVLESLQGEHAAILAQVREQEAVLERAWQDYRDCDGEYRQKKEQGITITDAMVYQNGLRVLERDIQRETDRLEELRRKEEKKRQEVVDAKIDTSSIEKLREKKLDLYNKEVAKGEEVLIDEFVSSARARASIGA
ncbi:MAG: flagellar export protein FliJ [Oscillospiraceae bacterium]|jgi:flagellar FliJ protein|nr:flagellar export protein FliJ [Oscillospiraceae bacterium]MCI8807155.1 flagellar export protein FliJ [Oscillospiraceae bacterium]